MTLEPETALTLVNRWANRSRAWTDDEKREAVEALVELAGVVTPHIVSDRPLGSLEQPLLLARALARLDDELVGVAAGLRRSWQLEALRHRPGTTEPALGLRSATRRELEALPGLDDALATKVGALVARRPDLTGIEVLTEIDGIGPKRLATLEAYAYLDRPRSMLLSATTWAFAMRPTLETFLDVLDAGDSTVIFGDANTVARRLAGPLTSPASRLVGFVRSLAERMRRRASLVDGVIASEGAQWMERRRKRRQRLDSLVPASGGLLIGGAYVDAVRRIIDEATMSLDLMVFLGTASAGIDGAPGSLALIEAMEAAAARGLAVRVILDQDDGGEPYKSYWINRPLVQRLAASGIQVRFDDKDTLLHSKVFVADGRIAVVGSHNWTRAAFTDTHEMSVLLRSPGVAEPFARRFDALWGSLPAIG